MSTLKAVNLKTKKIKWQKNSPDNIFWEPFLYKNFLFIFGGKRGEVLSAFDAKTGKLYWEVFGVDKYLKGPKPIIFKEKIYVSCKEAIVCINIEKGKKEWETQHGLTFALPLHIIENKLYYPVMDENKIQQYDFLTGELIKETYLNNKITSTFSYENGIIYYVSENTLYAEKVEL